MHRNTEENMNRIIKLRTLGLTLALFSLAPAIRAQDVSQDRPRFSAQATVQEISDARIFEEPLLPLGGTPSAEENAALGRALTAFLARAEHDDFSPIAKYLADHPNSPWNASLLCNLGMAYFRTGYFSLALDAYDRSWALAKNLTTYEGRAIGDRALTELVVMNARVGRFERLDALFAESKGRDVRGSAAERLAAAREARWDMENRPEVSFMCGPLALQRMHHSAKPGVAFPIALKSFVSTHKGTSLWQVRTVAKASGLAYEAVRRTGVAAIPIPSVIHWKAGHFAAVVGFSNGRYRIADPTFGTDMWVSLKAIQSEGSGYFLSPTAGLPGAFKVVGQKEAEGVWGKGRYCVRDGGGTSPDDEAAGGASGNGGNGNGQSNESGDGFPGGESGEGPGCGMPVYQFHAMLNSLNLIDIPLWYRPARGPKVEFRIDYNQKEGGQPSLFTYSNLGNKWTPAWVSWVADDPAVPDADAEVHPLGGGYERQQGFNAATASYNRGFKSGAGLFRTSSSPIRYERRYPNGAKHIYDKAEGATAFPRRIFLTKVVDPQGLAVTIGYDAQFRVATVTDAMGKVTTLSYGYAADIRRITKVTDPFGRFATLEYNAAGQLSKVTDMGGLSSTFTYGASDEITSMTTPYGTTQFRSGFSNFGSPKILTSWAEAIDPLGQKERMEYRHVSPWLEANPTAAPTGITASIDLKVEASTLFWGKKAMAEAPGDPKSAKVFHWMKYAEYMIDLYTSVLHSTKEPLEDRVWLNYYQQNGSTVATPGMVAWPTRVGRFLDDGSTQLYQTEYNANGNPIKFVDPAGRATVLTYDAAGINVLTVRRQQGTVNDLLATFTYNAQNRPLTSKDASGQTTTYTWNAQGQLLTVTNANAEKTTYAYDANGFVSTITGAQAADITTFTYDSFGRVASRKEPDGYLVKFEYDNLDRLTKFIYPDNSFEQLTYAKLDPEWSRDRLGRWTRTVFNALRQPVSVTDPAQRTTTLDWCACGDLKALVDSRGNRTEWKRDVQGRVTEKVYPDGKSKKFGYESRTSRLRTRTDAKGQVATYSWFTDGNLKQIAYSGGAIPTPTVSYTYEAAYERLKTLTDGTGTTQFAYKSITVPPAIGAGLLATIDGPLANDVVGYTYDKLGRVVGRTINSVAAAWVYDNLGRVTSESSLLGTFSYTYSGVSARVASMSYPNSQKTEFSYQTAAGDFLLKEIRNLTPAASPLSKSTYTYDAESRIKSWAQQADNGITATQEFNYDAADQLTGSIIKSSATGNPVLKHFAFDYDKSGNRLSAQENGTVSTFAYNSANQLVSQSAGGRMRFHGSVSEPATVQVDGQAAAVGADRSFDGTATVRAGKDTVSIAAKDYANNTRTNKYEVTTTGTAKAYTYDLNGNMTGDGTRSFEWDAENRLTAVVQGTKRSEFTYDGNDCRVRILEKDGATVTLDKRYLWVGSEIAEERDAAGGTVTKRYSDNGVMIGAAKYFYTKDHLGSIREMTNEAGVVQARYDYDPWGNRTRTAGTLQTDFGYTGHFHHVQSGLILTLYRAYMPTIGRWISRDPIGENDGPNIYSYVHNDPINSWDPDGTMAFFKCIPPVIKAVRGAKGAGKGKPPSVSPKPPAPKPPKPPKPPANPKPPSYQPDPKKPPGPDYEWKGRPGSKPGDKDGNWHNPKTKESYRNDGDHPPPIGPHNDYKDPNGKWWRHFPDGRVEPKP